METWDHFVLWLEGEKKSVRVPLTKTTMLLLDMQLIMILEMFGGNLKWWRVIFRKDHLSLSKAFSKSNLSIRQPLWFLVFFMRVIISWTKIALSQALRPFRKLVWCGLIRSFRKGLILLAIILVTTL